jgi:hypothetical protein
MSSEWNHLLVFVALRVFVHTSLVDPTGVWLYGSVLGL